jgi:hypothetical protein
MIDAEKQCCGSGIRCLLDSWIRDSGMGKKSESGTNNPDHISKSTETIVWVKKILRFFDADPGPGMEKFESRIRDGKHSDPG